jgi:hypothetical protein
MKTGFSIGNGVLSVLLFPFAVALAQEPPTAASPPEALESTLYVHIRPRQMFEWPVMTETRTLLSDARSRATLGISERAWMALPQIDSITVEVANMGAGQAALRADAVGTQLDTIVPGFAQDMANVDSPEVHDAIVVHADGSQTAWLWHGASETPPAIVHFPGFEVCPVQQSDDDALSVCARLSMQGSPPGVMWLIVRLSEGVEASFGVSLDNPEDLPEAERQLRLLLSADNEASSRALAFLGLQSVQQRVVIQSQGSAINVDVTLTAEETAGLARLLHEAIVSEVQ